MENIIIWIKANWVGLGVIYLAAIKVVTGIRDIVDKTPQSDDNLFEKICTVLGKLGGYLFLGQRPASK